jgi:hypothetical protein
MRQHVIGISVAAALSLVTMGHPVAQQPAPTVEVGTLGPQVGAIVPDFTLPDQHAVARSLKSLMGPKGAILVFFRSADW